MKKIMMITIVLIAIIISISIIKPLSVTTNDQGQKGLFDRDGVRGVLLNQTNNLRYIDRYLYSLAYLSESYNKEEIIRRLAYIEGIATVVPISSSVFILENGDDLLSEVMHNHIILYIQTAKFAEFLNKVNTELVNDNSLDKENNEIIEKYYKLYNSIAINYINLTREDNYKTKRELEKAQGFIHNISADLEKLNILNKSVLER